MLPPLMPKPIKVRVAQEPRKAPVRLERRQALTRSALRVFGVLPRMRVAPLAVALSRSR
jgi:hypothetical protein